MQSPLPGNEAARSQVLWNYRILDTPPEERFDDLVRVATYICGTPIGLVGLIDAGREWFKSKVGWDVSEIPREISFGTHTITQPDVLIVSDTLEDIDPQLKLQLGEQPFKPASVPTGFHPHAHPHPLCRKITVELLRCLTVLRRQRRPLPVRRPARKANLF